MILGGLGEKRRLLGMPACEEGIPANVFKQGNVGIGGESRATDKTYAQFVCACIHSRIICDTLGNVEGMRPRLFRNK